MNCLRETVSGLGNFLYVTWSNSDCGEINVCHTSKTHRSSDKRRGRPIFDVNTKLAAGMLHAGIGPSHVNALLTSINKPPVSQSTFKAREREVGPAIKEAAKASCEEAMEVEKECWRKETEEVVSIGASYDMGWQKRGKGHNSLKGVGSMVGLRSGKVLAYSTRNKRCTVCQSAKRSG